MRTLPKIREKWKFNMFDRVLCRGSLFIISSVNSNGTYNLIGYHSFMSFIQDTGSDWKCISFEEIEEDLELNSYCLIENLKQVLMLS